MLDRTNALDATWHGGGVGQETWDDLRIPYWMIRATYNFGQVSTFAGTLSDVFLETYWVPGLWTPLKFGYTPAGRGASRLPTLLVAARREETSNFSREPRLAGGVITT